MNAQRLRFILPLIILVALSIGFIVSAGTGTLSAVGWRDLSLLCPMGALISMLASKTIVPQAAISLGIAVVFIVFLGRAFCSWICPVPLVSRLRTVFKKKQSTDKNSVGVHESPGASTCASRENCTACRKKPAHLDSRHVVLGGAITSAALFGFPVFCLVCPIGLSFATIFLLISLFGSGDVTWSVVVAPMVLLAEVVFFRKWCAKICPLSAFMSLIAKVNRTFRPTFNKEKCIEVTSRADCGKCASACAQHIDLRYLESSASQSECTRCRSCVEVCPAHAITLPVLRPKKLDTGEKNARQRSQP